jgi:hypothetical protein
MKNIIVLSIILILSSCKMLGIEPGLEKISFKPTQCANPWDQTVLAAPNPSSEEKFKAYLAINGISEVLDFKITRDNGVYCEACTCVGSETYHFKIKKDDLNTLKTIAPFDELLV